MAFKCKQKRSKSKRKCVSCKGCKYLQKTKFWGINKGNLAWRCVS